MNIKTLDLQSFLGGDNRQKEEFVQDLGKCMEEIGFVIIRGHLLSTEIQEKMYDQVKAFFDLPGSTKSSYEKPELHSQRGFTSFGKEHAKDSEKADLKEFWQFGQNLSIDECQKLGYPENLVVNELPHFNETMDSAFQVLENTGLALLRAIALYLNLEETYFDSKVADGNSIIRAIHYPPITESPKGAVRAGAHGDINLITLLMGASAGGLQVLEKSGDWLDINPKPDELVINTGDMLSRLTNNKLKSTIHRVVNPPSSEWDKPRFSIPFFMHPRAEMDLSCLGNCCSKENPKQYEDISAGDFLDQRLREIGLKKG